VVLQQSFNITTVKKFNYMIYLLHKHPCRAWSCCP